MSSLTTRGLCCSVKFYTCHVQFDLEVMNGRDGGILSQLTVLGLRQGCKLIGLLHYLVKKMFDSLFNLGFVNLTSLQFDLGWWNFVSSDSS